MQVAGWRAGVLSALLALAAGAVGAAQDGGEAPPRRLVAGTPVAAVIDRGVQDWAPFDFEIPDDAVECTVTLVGAPVDLDCYLRFGEPMTEWEGQADHRAATETWNERLRVSRWHDPPLQPGRCYLDVAYRLDVPPRIDGVRVDRIGFGVRLDVVRAAATATLAPALPACPSVTATATLEAANGHAAFFTVEIPEGAPALRLDVADVAGDVDLFVRRTGWPLDPDTVDHEATTLAGRESLVLDPRSQPPLEPGRWHVAVVDRVQDELPVTFTLHATLGRDPPAPLLAIPPPREGRTPLEVALYGTVEILAHGGSGSGVLVTPDGLVLTNHHVVLRADDTVPSGNDLVVGLTLDPRLPARECFRAAVLHHDAERDLALCEIRTGFYGQPLPAGYRFRPVPLGDADALAIGDRLDLVGFPDTGGMRSRVSVTLSRGHVAGFERHAHGYLIKTDAELSNGSSGGAALDAAGRLVGVPSDTVGAAQGFGQLGFVRPLSLLPPTWRALIAERLGKTR